jgi:hypothetical protein
MNYGRAESVSWPPQPAEAAKTLLATYTRDEVAVLIALLQIGIGESAGPRTKR